MLLTAELNQAAALKTLANASRLLQTFKAQTFNQDCCSFLTLETPTDIFTILFNRLVVCRLAPEIFLRSLCIWHLKKYVTLLRYGSALIPILQSVNYCRSIIHYLKQQHRSPPVKYSMIWCFISPLSHCAPSLLRFYLPGINGLLWVFSTDFGQNLWIPSGNGSLGSCWRQTPLVGSKLCAK